MSIKRFFAALSLMVIFAMLMAACGTGKAPEGGDAGLTIAGVVFQDDQFMKSMVQGYEDAGAKYGVKILTANTNNDQAKEAELIQTYIAQGVNGIAIAPLSQDASIPNLKDATSKGIQVAITNMNLSGDSSWLAGGYTSDDATNGKIVGTNAAEFIKANITGAVNVAQVDFDHQIPEQSKARYTGFYHGLDEAGIEYTKVAAVSANMQDDALTKVTDMLTAHPEINVIWASNDGGTIGAAMAVQQAGLAGKVFVFGYDGGDQQTSMILSSDHILVGVVSQDPYTQGFKAVESLALTLQGKTNPDAGKITVVPGMYLSSDDPAGVNAWRKANGLEEVQADEASAQKELTIAGVVFQDDQFMKSMVQGFEDAGAKYGIKIMTANTNNDQAKEAELIQTYIAQGVDGIAIAPLSQDASIPNLKDAQSQGIEIAITNMNLSGDPSWLAGGYTSDDATNGKIVGTNAAEFIKANLTGPINVAQVDFDHQIPEQSKARYNGFFAGLDEAGIEYIKVASVSANMQDDALTKVTDMLTAHPEINVIWASNDGGTIGAAMAVKQAGLQGKVFVFGYDGGDQQTSMILSGDNILIGVVAQDPYAQGYKAVESLALTLLEQSNPDAGKITVVPGTYLSTSDTDGVKQWRTDNGLK
jgi:simple sugar transport system substrate-binding protein/ribose transport system substrate-binding protein